MFADIAGFTAWSSVRDPGQVFTLLEQAYGSFDAIAKQRGVFKVETIGDCYVAVAGLPVPNPQHAVTMVRFASDCRDAFQRVARDLEVTLGVGTADLQFRFGLNSGPCTAGVLRGEKSRFQLFGDTVNTAARMESSGKPNKIHVSQATADLLKEAGKGHWLTACTNVIEAKGKGRLQTYFVDVNAPLVSSTETKPADVVEEPVASVGDTASRFVDWNIEVLSTALRQIGARRVSPNKKATFTPNLVAKKVKSEVTEVKEIIALPAFDSNTSLRASSASDVKLSPTVLNELGLLVRAIARMYPDNPFHNLEHASHVTMSVVKLLKRIVTPEEALAKTKNPSKIAAAVHDCTYGIVSDPLAQFACIFAAFVHDADHPGVPNSQLVKEKSEMALVYSNKSVAEKNSLELAWDLLSEPECATLLAFICPNESELYRFRQLLVNLVIGTDIMDKDLKKISDARWKTAFAESNVAIEQQMNCKATIVMLHLIQASDVSHTMQHWHIFRKWNENLFEEMYLAYCNGRSDTNPADNWYQSEIGFFDFYILPLARKLRDCGVFGVSSDEYLTYAQKNREEWKERGVDIVADMVENAQVKYGSKNCVE